MLSCKTTSTYVTDPVEGVPNQMRSSGTHTEGHHLIRCLALKRTNEKDKGITTEQRLSTTKERLDGMQKQVDDMGGLTGRMGGSNWLHWRPYCIGNVDQLLQKLVRAREGRTA